jgi:hypothetical protein
MPKSLAGMGRVERYLAGAIRRENDCYVVDPDGVSVESRLPNATGAAIPLKGLLDDQCRKYSAKHSPPPVMR